MAEIKVPVLLIAFNRPDVLNILLSNLSEHNFRKLYVFIDHEIDNNPDDAINVEACRALVKKINFSDQVITYFSQNNLGCGLGPFTAISWAFEKEEQLIILEDDCIPSPAFFPYCEELLDRYRDNRAVWMISGNNFSEGRVEEENSYTFSAYSHFWGWATWKDRWEDVEYDRKQCLLKIEDIPNDRFLTSREREFFIADYRANFSKPADDVWDYQAALAMSLNDGLSIIPRRNLVSNIGSSGTHFKSTKPFLNMKTDRTYTIEKHPMQVQRDVEYDRSHFEHHWLLANERSLLERIASRWKRFVDLQKGR